MGTILSLPLDAHGVIEPVVRRPHPEKSGESIFSHVAPYSVSLRFVFETFVFNPRREALARGLLDYRHSLREAGMDVSLQWIAGSFVELAVEAPNDIDLVNFYRPPPHISTVDQMKAFADANSRLFTKVEAKQAFGCEPNFVLLNNQPERLVAACAYWATLYGASRGSGRQKGFVTVAGDPAEDGLAAAWLSRYRPHPSPLP